MSIALYPIMRRKTPLGVVVNNGSLEAIFHWLTIADDVCNYFIISDVEVYIPALV